MADYGPSITHLRLVAALRSLGLHPEVEYPFSKITGSKPHFGYRADIAFPDAKLIVEVDGLFLENGERYHASPEQIKKDNHKDEVSNREGWLTQRYTADEIFDEGEYKFARKINDLYKIRLKVVEDQKEVEKNRILLNEIIQKNNALQEDKQHLNKEISFLKERKISASGKTLIKLKKKISEKVNKLKNLETSLAKSNREKSELLLKINNKETEIRNLQEEIKKLKEKIEEGEDKKRKRDIIILISIVAIIFLILATYIYSINMENKIKNYSTEIENYSTAIGRLNPTEVIQSGLIDKFSLLYCGMTYSEIKNTFGNPNRTWAGEEDRYTGEQLGPSGVTYSDEYYDLAIELSWNHDAKSSLLNRAYLYKSGNKIYFIKSLEDCESKLR